MAPGKRSGYVDLWSLSFLQLARGAKTVGSIARFRDGHEHYCRTSVVGRSSQRTPETGKRPAHQFSRDLSDALRCSLSGHTHHLRQEVVQSLFDVHRLSLGKAAHPWGIVHYAATGPSTACFTPRVLHTNNQLHEHSAKPQSIARLRHSSAMRAISLSIHSDGAFCD